MDAKEHLYYGLGIVAFAAAKADGEIQVTEQKELHELVHEWSEKYSRDFDVTEIIFSVLKNSKPGFAEGFEDGMKYIRLGSNHLDEQTKEHFIYLIQDIAHAFPPVTHAEEDIIRRFKDALSKIKIDHMLDESSNGQLYELLFETATEGLIVADSEGQIRLANDRSGEIFGYSVAELKSMSVDELLPNHLRKNHVGHRKNFAKSPHKRPMGRGYDLIGVRKDGTSVPVEISLNYYKQGGNLMVMALIMDVTVRKEQEAQVLLLNKNLERRVEKRTQELEESQLLYRMIARNFPNGTINVFDKSFNYVFVEGQDLYRNGITSERLVGKNYLNQLPAEIREEIQRRLEKVFDGENTSFELMHQDQYYMINAVGLTDQSGVLSRVLMVEQNITDRKNAEQKLVIALEKEKQLNELKSRFVSMASHEFRTPLSTVLSSLSLLEKYDEAGLMDKKPKHYDRIKGSVRHLTSLLNDFLSIEKVEAGKVALHKSKLNIRELLGEIVEQHQEIAKEGQTIQYDFEGLSEFRTDQNMLRIILSNLLSNAIKYSKEHQRIWVHVVNSKDQINMMVRDEGIGIPLRDQDNMFGRFFRAQNALNLEGTGLGLNIVNRYLQLLNGKISFESMPNEGTTFSVEIPS